MEQWQFAINKKMAKTAEWEFYPTTKAGTFGSNYNRIMSVWLLMTSLLMKYRF